MLTSLRSKTAGWVAKIFIALLAASFAMWGVSDVFTGYGSDTVATVGDREIAAESFTNNFNQRVRALSERMGRSITAAEARQMGVDRQVLGQLVQNAALEEQGRRLGLAIPDDVVARGIVSNPAFQNAQGDFDRRGFERLLNANGLSEAGFVQLERERMMRASVASAIDQQFTVPDVLLEAVHAHRDTTRSGRYFDLPPDAAGDIPAPAQDQVETYYEDHKRAFTAPEFRTLALLRLQPGDIVDTVSVGDEELRNAYEYRKEEFTEPERRMVLQVPFEDTAAAQAARERIASGTDFTAVASERGLSEQDYRLGLVTRRNIPDERIAEAAFALSEGEVSQPVEGRLSTVLLTVERIEPGSVSPFAEVRDELAHSLKLDRAKDEIVSLHDRIEDQRAGGATLREIAESMDLPLTQIDAVDRSGNGPDGEPLQDIPTREEVVNLAFESDVGVENDPVHTAEEGFVWVDVIDVVPEAVKPLEEVRDEVVRQWTAERRREALQERARALVDRAGAGTSFEALAQEIGATVNQVGPLTRGETVPGFGEAEVAALFGTPLNQLTSAYDEGQSTYAIIEPTQSATPDYSPDSEEARNLAQALRSNMGDDLFGQYLQDLQTTLGVEINNEVWPRVSGQQS